VGDDDHRTTGHIGKITDVKLPRPRTRQGLSRNTPNLLLAIAREVLDFLEEYEPRQLRRNRLPSGGNRNQSNRGGVETMKQETCVMVAGMASGGVLRASFLGRTEMAY